VIVAGLGDAARTHIYALERITGTEVVAGVDTAPGRDLVFREHAVPVYRTLRDASSRHACDVVVIATPTSTHAAVCAEAAGCFPAARILVEKPAADNLPDARHVLADIGGRQPVDVAFHMAFSPEVTWGAGLAAASEAELGGPAAIEASFADPYQERFEQARASLGSSWIDSGINSLSVISRFASLTGRESLRRISSERHSAFEARIRCRARDQDFTALILTSWHVTDPAKATRITFQSGAQLVLDHTAVAGYLIQDGHVTAISGSDREIPRRERHYLALYDWWLTRGNPVFPAAASLRLHELLLGQPTRD